MCLLVVAAVVLAAVPVWAEGAAGAVAHQDMAKVTIKSGTIVAPALDRNCGLCGFHHQVPA